MTAAGTVGCREYCSAKTRSGGSCKRPAGWGTQHVGIGACKLHGGSVPNHMKHAQKIQAERAVATLGLPRDVAPHVALLEEVHRAAGHVAWIGEIVGRMQEKELVQGVTKAIRHPDGTQTVEAQAAISVWVKLYHDERDRLVRVSKAALDAGVAERFVRLAEQEAQHLASVVKAILTDLGHDLADPQVREVVKLRLVA